MYPECENCEWNIFGNNGCACLFKDDASYSCPDYSILLDEHCEGQLADRYDKMFTKHGGVIDG